MIGVILTTFVISAVLGAPAWNGQWQQTQQNQQTQQQQNVQQQQPIPWQQNTQNSQQQQQPWQGQQQQQQQQQVNPWTGSAVNQLQYGNKQQNNLWTQQQQQKQQQQQQQQQVVWQQTVNTNNPWVQKQNPADVMVVQDVDQQQEGGQVVADLWPAQPEVCTEGSYQAGASADTFKVCANGRWMDQTCAPGTMFDINVNNCVQGTTEPKADNGNQMQIELPQEPAAPAAQQQMQPQNQQPEPQQMQMQQQMEQMQQQQQQPRQQNKPAVHQQPQGDQSQQVWQPSQKNQWVPPYYQSPQPWQPVHIQWQPTYYHQPMPYYHPKGPKVTDGPMTMMPMTQPMTPTPAPMTQAPMTMTPEPMTPEPSTPEPSTPAPTPGPTMPMTDAPTPMPTDPVTQPPKMRYPEDPWFAHYKNKCTSGTRRAVASNNDAFEVCDNGEYVFMLCAPGTWFDTEVNDCSDGYTPAPAWMVPKDMVPIVPQIKEQMKDQIDSMNKKANTEAEPNKVVNMVMQMIPSDNGNVAPDVNQVMEMMTKMDQMMSLMPENKNNGMMVMTSDDMQKIHSNNYGNADMQQQMQRQQQQPMVMVVEEMPDNKMMMGNGMVMTGNGMEMNGAAMQMIGNGIAMNGVHMNGNGMQPNGNGMQMNGNGMQMNGNGMQMNGNGMQMNGNGVKPVEEEGMMLLNGDGSMTLKGENGEVITMDGMENLVQMMGMKPADIVETIETKAIDTQLPQDGDPNLWLNDVREIIIVSVEKCKVGRTRKDESPENYQECIMNPYGTTMWIRRRCAPGTLFSPWTRNCGKVNFRYNNTDPWTNDYNPKEPEMMMTEMPTQMPTEPTTPQMMTMPPMQTQPPTMPPTNQPTNPPTEPATNPPTQPPTQMMMMMTPEPMMKPDEPMKPHNMQYNPYSAWDNQIQQYGQDNGQQKDPKKLTITFQLDRGYNVYK